MDISKHFAVVDLETTGTNKGEDRIIQFGCTLIDNGVISDSISILVNPHQRISTRIQELTNISNDTVKNAPSFEEVADQIFNYLKGRTFVAHNVNFDFPFIKAALKKSGYDNLDIPAIDTVELSQILLPQLSSFKLQDISDYLNIEHDHPHRADDDSNVTAKLLLILIQRINMLPITTLKKICLIGESTIRETGELFSSIYQKRINDANILQDYLYEKNGLVLRRKTVKVNSNVDLNTEYPVSKSDKISSFNNVLEYRSEQAKMMNSIHSTLLENSSKKWTILEAPTGIGKTIGYLYPISFQISDRHKLVIATTTTVLQNQILDEAIPFLNQLQNYSYHAQVVKSSYNYLDLDRFYNTLSQDLKGHKTTAILKMKILVWLTMTTTGDLDELRLSNTNIDYLSLISHRGEDKINTLFAEDDFWKFSINEAKRAEILITNQSYFALHLSDKIWGDNPYLVIDEAHHFADNLRKNNSPSFNMNKLNSEVKKISDTLYQNREDLKENFNNNFIGKWSRKDLQLMESFFQEFETATAKLDDYVYQNYFLNKLLSDNKSSYLETRMLNKDIKQPARLISYLSEIKESLTKIILEIDKLIRNYFGQNDFIGLKISGIISNLSLYNNSLRRQTVLMLDLITKLNDEHQLFGVSFQLKNQFNSSGTNIVWYKLDINDEINTVNQKFNHIFMVGGALNSSDNFNFFKRDLQLTDELIHNAEIFKNQYNLDDRTRVYIPNDSKNIKNMNEDEYSSYLSEMIKKFLGDNPHQALVLFNSLSTMNEVYIKLSESSLSNKKEILAQGINGNNEKIKKRFSHSKNSILLGSNSFWEGVDFPQKVLEIVIITRLPFDSPDQNETMIRSKYLSKLQLNAFNEDALPRATLKLRQGYGRLIRTPTDKGVMIILDDRIIKSKYGKEMLSNFPEKSIKKNYSSNEIKENLEEFLN
ncbi:3'-5' exonuclease [Companilactobacillus sp. RD055328]|uniref:helicase C-terminal domain-containing protein n=1 Tax=Companilactobacillus sp. RD055328 TaxID=2916634 RepID=UPI001FC83B38|nr:helicase C-terminal domain-containing protein [Companilactobacillus sp. RD055328]GKQ42681.1 3'-5' exonuclease [Companilactobacillus sp. RD055328]